MTSEIAYIHGSIRPSALYSLIKTKSEYSLASGDDINGCNANSQPSILLMPVNPGLGNPIPLDEKLRAFLEWLGTSRSETTALEKANAIGINLEQLILRGLIETYIEGRWVTGPSASHILDRLAINDIPTHPIGQISLAAVDFGIEHPISDQIDLAKRLYLFHRLPIPESLTASEEKEHPADLIRRLLTRQTIGGWARTLSHGYWSFRRKHLSQLSSESPPFKLYLSPQADSLVSIVQQLLIALSRTGAYAFKIGAGLLGMQRPDKIIAYFTDLDSLLEAEDALSFLLYNQVPHGVPFTIPLDESGVASWSPGASFDEKQLALGLSAEQSMNRNKAMEGPFALPDMTGYSVEDLCWPKEGSWRHWLSSRLASSILLARTFGANKEVTARYCLALLETYGVETSKWIFRPTTGS